jgi:glycosyltransferase involved in cell wall biosynthesis
MKSNSFRVVHLCKSTGNGGFIAAWRLHSALLANGVDSHMVVRERNGRSDLDLIAFDDSKIWWLWFRFRGFLSRILHRLLLGPKAIEDFYLQWIPTFIPRSIRKKLKPDILHVHCPDDGLWALYELGKWKQPIVWTFHAYRDFSQGYIYLAHRQQQWLDAGSIGSLHDQDQGVIAHCNLAFKKKLMSKRHDICISPSYHVHAAGKISGVFANSEHHMIRNCVPIDFFKETGRDEWRINHQIESDDFVLLVGAHALDYKIKGFDLFVNTITKNKDKFRDHKIVFCFFGSGVVPDIIREIGRVIELGYLDEIALRGAYSGSDLFVIPSREDNFPNVIIEALGCGLLYVGFDTGGVGEMVRENAACGIIAPCFDLEKFSDAMLIIINESLTQRLDRRVFCRQAVAIICDPSLISKQHIDLYSEISF